jgi:small subunit ribosomal protein S3
MGQKVHPHGFRIGVIYGWESRWYADRNYTELLHDDLKLRSMIMSQLGDAGISRVEIDRNANQIGVTIHTAKPGIVIGRGGQKVDELRTRLEKLTEKRIRLNIVEIRQPELDAYLVAKSVAEQLQRRVAFRRAMKQAVQRTMQRGARGIKIIVGGRLGGSEMSRSESEMQGRVPLHTLRADIDYGLAEAHTTFGRIGVKVWIYKGDILPERKVSQVQGEPAVARMGDGAGAVAEVETEAPVSVAAAPEAGAAAEAPEAVAPAEAEPVAEAPEAAAPAGTEPVAEAPEAAAPAEPEAEAPAVED